MAMLHMSNRDDGESWRALLTRHLPGLDFRVHPDHGDPPEIDAVLAWYRPLDALAAFPNLRLLTSLGAGVDHIVEQRHLIPDGVVVTRIVDPAMTAQMTEWCAMAVTARLRRWDDYRALQRERRYEGLAVPRPDQVTIGIMGLGVLGRACARLFRAMGYGVRGWSRGPGREPGVACFHGPGGLKAFLASCDVLICLLPLTPDTSGILNRRTLAWLKPGCHVINAARGGLVIERDLIAAIDAGHVAAATVDVQSLEPMPDDHPFWYHPRIVSFPHVAAFTVPETGSAQVAANYSRLENGEALENEVDLERGY